MSVDVESNCLGFNFLFDEGEKETSANHGRNFAAVPGPWQLKCLGKNKSWGPLFGGQRLGRGRSPEQAPAAHPAIPVTPP
jgi:hypothetical protein